MNNLLKVRCCIESLNHRLPKDQLLQTYKRLRSSSPRLHFRPICHHPAIFSHIFQRKFWDSPKADILNVVCCCCEPASHIFSAAARLAPMAICLPTVVTEFTKLTARLGLMNCQAHLPGNAEASKSQRPLEMFFPFDPYLLRRSATFLDLHRTFLRQALLCPRYAILRLEVLNNVLGCSCLDFKVALL